MTDDELTTLEALAEKATPLINEHDPHVTAHGGIVLLYGPYPLDRAKVIAQFYASAREALPALVAEVRKLRAALTEVKDRIDCDTEEEVNALLKIIDAALQAAKE